MSDANKGDFAKLSWSRAARTDKGVSAVGQVVACKLVLDPPGLVARVNDALPPSVRVFAVVRCVNGFNAKNLCERRRYSYLLPASALDPRWPSSPPAARGHEGDAALPSVVDAGDATDPAAPESTAAAPATPFNAAAAAARLNGELARYVGTHKFHNFTPKLKASDPSSRRFIASFASSPLALHGAPWLHLQVVGQSFLLHQIRCMVGAAVAVVRGYLPAGFIADALSPSSSSHAPMAPALGLYLSEALFGAYNAKWGGTHPAVGIEQCCEAEARAFETTSVWEHIAATEAREGVAAAWCASLSGRGGGAGEAGEAGDLAGEPEEAGAAGHGGSSDGD